jgi:hypothetical protein
LFKTLNFINLIINIYNKSWIDYRLIGATLKCVSLLRICVKFKEKCFALIICLLFRTTFSRDEMLFTKRVIVLLFARKLSLNCWLSFKIFENLWKSLKSLKFFKNLLKSFKSLKSSLNNSWFTTELLRMSIVSLTRTRLMCSHSIGVHSKSCGSVIRYFYNTLILDNQLLHLMDRNRDHRKWVKQTVRIFERSRYLSQKLHKTLRNTSSKVWNI